MTATAQLLNHLFRPAHILLVGPESSPLEDALLRVCACDLDHYAGGNVNEKYDMVLVDEPDVTPELFERLQQSGPVVLVGHANSKCAGKPVAVLPETTEHAIADVFRLLKVKMRTPDVVDAIAQIGRAPTASGGSSGEFLCATQAA